MHKTKIRTVICTFLILFASISAGCSNTAGIPSAESYVDEANLSGTTATAGDDIPTEKEVSPLQIPSSPSLPAAGTGASSAAGSEKASSASASSGVSVPEVPDDGKDYIEILFLGDSQFASGRGTDTDIPTIVRDYVQIVDDADCFVYNLGVADSATTIQSEEKELSPENWSSVSLLSMAHLLNGDGSLSALEHASPEAAAVYRTIRPEKIDYIVIEYGIHDYLNGTTAVDKNDDRTLSIFSNAYEASLFLLRNAFPQATILCCTPCFAQLFGPDGAFLGTGGSLDNGSGNLGTYVGLIDYWYRQFDRTLYVDMYNGQRMDLDSYTADEYLADGILLTPEGRRAFGAVVAQVINKDRGAVTEEYQLIEIDAL